MKNSLQNILLVGTIIFILLGTFGLSLFLENLKTGNLLLCLALILIIYVVGEIIYVRGGESLMVIGAKVETFKDFMWDNLFILMISTIISFYIFGAYYSIRNIGKVIRNIGGFIVDSSYTMIGFVIDNKDVLVILFVIGLVIILKCMIYTAFVKVRRK